MLKTGMIAIGLIKQNIENNDHVARKGTVVVIKEPKKWCH